MIKSTTERGTIFIEDLPNEIWVTMYGFSKDHQISNFGRVKSLQRKFRKNEKLLCLCLNGSGYLQYYIAKKSLAQHQLIAIFFIPNTENKPEVNHIDGNKLNNKIDNLEWSTEKENIDHAIKHKLRSDMIGINNFSCKLTEIKVYEILNSKDSLINLSKKYNVSTNQIWSIRTGKSWKHITKPFLLQKTMPE